MGSGSTAHCGNGPGGVTGATGVVIIRKLTEFSETQFTATSGVSHVNDMPPNDANFKSHTAAGGASLGAFDTAGGAQQRPATMVEMAKVYASWGWPVFPAKMEIPKDPTKSVIKKSHKSAKFSNGRNWGCTTDPAEIERDFSNRKWLNSVSGIGIGVALGGDTETFVVDIDTLLGHRDDGFASIDALEAVHGPLPETLTAVSPSGSKHLYFRCPPGVKIRSNSIGPGVDIKGDGGMVIAPLSRHPKGGEYRWENFGTPIAEAPDWLIDMVRDDGKRQRRQSVGGGERRTPQEPPPEWLIKKLKEHPEHIGRGKSKDFDDNYDPVDINKVAAAVVVIPNDDLPWDDWNNLGMALYRATGGSPEGCAIFHSFSGKSSKYDAADTDAKWNTYHTSPPAKVGVGTLFFKADKADPGWKARFMKGKEPAFGDGSAGAEDTNDSAEEGEDVGAEDTTGSAGAGGTKGSASNKLIQSSGEFVANFQPPDYLIDGVIQRRYVYSLTSPTGRGKTSVVLRIAAHASLGTSLAGREIEQVRVLMFVGENPDDVRMRWIKLCEVMGQDPNDLQVSFLPGIQPLSVAATRRQIEREVAKIGDVGLVIVDTSAAYFEGVDENSNVQMGVHARLMRSLVNLPGGPSVIVTTHPVKNASNDNLLPRGGGAYLNEMDGNLVLYQRGDMVVALHWQGKHRGPEFEYIHFKIEPGTTEKLKTTKGKPVWTVTARPISDAEASRMEDRGQSRLVSLLQAIKAKPAASLMEFAVQLGWVTKGGQPSKSEVHRVMKTLLDANLVSVSGKVRTVTKAGDEMIETVRNEPL